MSKSGNFFVNALDNGDPNFRTIHSSVVLAGKDPSLAARKAFETLCRTLWRPLFAFVRRDADEWRHLISVLRT